MNVLLPIKGQLALIQALADFAAHCLKGHIDASFLEQNLHIIPQDH